MVASELVMPWRAVEAMHWQMGVEDINARANERVFQSHPAAAKPRSPPPSTPGSSGGEAAGPTIHLAGLTRSRRSSSAASNRRRTQSDVAARSERVAQPIALPAVSEAAPGGAMRPRTATALLPTNADELYATPSPPRSYRGLSMEGSSAGNPPTPQRERDHRRSGSFASSSGVAREHAIKPEHEGPST